MCTDIDGGDTFREEIVANVRDAKVFLIFLNEKWAKSQECTFEYNYAMVTRDKQQWHFVHVSAVA